MTAPALAARPSLADRFELIAAGVLAAAFTTPGMLLLGVSEDPAAPENPIFRLYWPPIYLGVLLLSAWRAPRLARGWAPALLCLLLVAWAAASQSWSIMPDVTGRRVIALAMTTLFGLYLGTALSGRRFVEMLAAGYVVLALGSVAVSLALPRFGLMHDVENGGDWRGLWSHKNALASNMAVGAMASVCAALAAPARRRRWLIGFVVCLALLLLSRGKTGLVSLLLGLSGAAVLSLLRRGPAPAVLTVWLGGCVATGLGLVAWLAPDALFRAIGKDPTLTGRTDIWAAVLRQSADHPWLGYGFAAFWEPGSTPAAVIRKQTHWLVPSAHNGWLDLLVQLGWVGVILFGVVFAIALLAAAIRSARLGDGYFSVLFLLMFGLVSLSESVLEQHNSAPWALFAAALTRALAPLRAPVTAPRPVDPHRPIWREQALHA